jgi:hypothetical protein
MRLSVWVSDAIEQRLSDAAGQRGVERSTIVCQVLMAALEPTCQTDRIPTPPHDLGVWGRSVLAECRSDVRERFTATAHHFRVPLSEGIPRLLLTLAKHPGADIPHSDVWRSS